MRTGFVMAIAGAFVALAGCASDEGEYAYATRGLNEADRSVGATSRERSSRTTARDEPAAFVNGVGIAWADLRTRMAERVGGAVLQEVALERLLAEACAREGITITEEDLARERRLLIDTLADDDVATDDATRKELLGVLLRSRNLGEAGFDALLRRTAMSRALVRDEVTLSEDAIRRAADLRFGERYRARLIVTSTPAQGAEALRRLRAGEAFADVAAELSTDASAGAGGRIPLINPADLSWPAAIRRAVRSTPIGEPTPLIAIENGYALLVVEDVIVPDDGGRTEEEKRALARRDARLEAERLLMARLARDLLASADVDIPERALERSWERVSEQ